MHLLQSLKSHLPPLEKEDIEKFNEKLEKYGEDLKKDFKLDLPAGFEIIDYEINFKGVCDKCQKGE